MKEKRKHKRFKANLPARLEAVTLGKTKVLDIETKDISVSGAFIYTRESPFLPGETRFIMDLTIPKNSFKELTDLKSLIECEGSVVWYKSEGMAIHFDRKCHIMSLRGS